MYQTMSRVTMLPLLGTIGAGTGVLADEQLEDMIAIPSDMVRNATGAFLLRIKGDSMIGDGIMERDLVVVKPQNVANQGDLVAVYLDEEATVKRYNKTKQGIFLMPSNPDYSPIPVAQENAGILGKVIGLIRDYEGAAF
jgi:repressor LexA